jgi:Ca2+-binding EF-hand superfamily protein
MSGRSHFLPPRFAPFLPLNFVLAVAVLPLAHAAAQTTPPPTPAAVPVTLQPLDGDADGKVTRAEWTRFVQSFSKLDGDGNQGIDEAELRKAGGDAVEKPGVLVAADSNGDGKLTRPEWTQLARGFARYDKNNDGNITQPEMQATADAAKDAAKPGNASGSNGLWRGRIVQGRGENPNSGEEIELAIAGNRIAGRNVRPQSDGTPNLGIGTFVMTGNGQSGYLDAQYVEGGTPGQVCLGIFKMENGALYWCASNRNGNRPTDFATGNGNWLMILRKVDPPPQQ